MTEEEFKKYVNRMNKNIGNLLKNKDEELTFYIQLVSRFNDICNEKEIQKEIIDKAIEKVYCWGEALDPEFQKEILEILKGGKINERNKI